jgi:hypothetical protein
MIYIPDLNLPQTSLVVLVQIHIDGEMCIDVSHLVLEAFCDANNQVVDKSSDRSESSNIFASTMVELDVDDVLLGVREVDCEMAEVLGELALEGVRLWLLKTRFCAIPRGPSTVTSLDLIVTLTITSE